MRTSKSQVPHEFVSAIDEALDLLKERENGQVGTLLRPEPLPSLLDQCREFLNRRDRLSDEPIRTIHHFACTGGTLISKCIASLPNMDLLSEVDPLSTLGPASRGGFLPTDLIGLTRWGSRGISDDLAVEVFLSGLTALYKDRCQNGLRVVVRDHAHSHFCVGDHVQPRPTLLEMLGKRLVTRSILTVRHPIDSYLSLQENGWMHFTPGSIDEYVRRYDAFLDRHQDLEMFRYEDFVHDPESVMRRIASSLSAAYNDQFASVFSVFRFSGGSGRKGAVIGSRARRTIPGELVDEIARSAVLPALCERMGYVVADTAEV